MAVSEPLGAWHARHAARVTAKAGGDRLLTIRQLATQWGRSYAWVSARLKSGAIPHFKVDGVHYVRESEAEAWLEAQRATAAPARFAQRDREEFCREMGIEVDHQFT